TADSTATAGSDYTAKSGTLTFAAGVTSVAVLVTIAADLAVEPDEMFFLNLKTPVNATIADGRGIGTILNDDGNLQLQAGRLEPPAPAEVASIVDAAIELWERVGLSDHQVALLLDGPRDLIDQKSSAGSPAGIRIDTDVANGYRVLSAKS